MPDLVFNIDTEFKRRAAISFHLNNHGVRTEPFESIEEFFSHAPKAGIILIHDDEGTIASLTSQICRLETLLAVVAYSEDPEPARIVKAVHDGAVGYAAWPPAGDSMIRALQIARDRPEARVAAGSRRAFALGRLERLSRRELEILAGMAEGLSNRRIAVRLGISPRTVELHRANMLDKVGAQNSAQAIRLAIDAGITTLEVRPLEETD